MDTDRCTCVGFVHVLSWVNLVLSCVGGVLWLPLSLVVGFATDGGHSRFATALSHAWTAAGIASILSFGVGLTCIIGIHSRALSAVNVRVVISANTVAVLVFIAAWAWLIPLVAHTAHW